MGLIREPKNVDYCTNDKKWTEKELKEFSEFIRKDKEKRIDIEKDEKTHPLPLSRGE